LLFEQIVGQNDSVEKWRGCESANRSKYEGESAALRERSLAICHWRRGARLCPDACDQFKNASEIVGIVKFDDDFALAVIL
jgi:hypothetical protein